MSKAMVKSVEVKLDPKSGDIEKLKLDLKKLIYSTENANTVCHIPTIYSDGTGDDKNYSVSLPISKTSPLYAVGKKYYLRYNIQKEILGVVDETDPVGKQLIEASKLLKLSLCKQINEMPADKKMQLFNKCGLNYDMLADQKIETTILFKDLIENAKYSEFDAPDPSFAHKVNPTKSKSMSIGLWMKKNDEIGKSSGQIPLKNNDESSSSSSLINFTYTRICSAIGSSSPIELKDWDQAEKLLFYAKKDQKKKFEQPESAQKHFFTISKIETLAPSLYVSQGGFKLVWKMKSITVFHKEEIEYTNIIKAAKDEKMTMEYCNYVNSINESVSKQYPELTNGDKDNEQQNNNRSDNKQKKGDDESGSDDEEREKKMQKLDNQPDKKDNDKKRKREDEGDNDEKEREKKLSKTQS